jgi:hypothetical protein
MVYLRTVFALIACKEASLFGVDSCSCTPASTFYKLLEIERVLSQDVKCDFLLTVLLEDGSRL